MTMPLNHANLPRCEGADLQSQGLTCMAARSRLHGLRCAGELVRGFLAPRLITLLVVLGLVAMVWLSLTVSLPQAV
jgi:hypothetical protein